MNTKGFEPVAPAGAGDHRSALLAGYLGWTLDAFDFFLVVMCLTAIGREFHRSDREMALATVVTLAFRPVGAFIFGLLADRYGRRLPLMLDLPLVLQALDDGTPKGVGDRLALAPASASASASGEASAFLPAPLTLSSISSPAGPAIPMGTWMASTTILTVTASVTICSIIAACKA